ncbi:hypothetical protein NDU88_003101 [Pleurodeles waltl]|uniref:LRAT domain-containing protein n=1 Tax=Pleurodeles waltl TaxID=8319 RepID=A0AAV7MPK5_PLEWA|nr:hypothetical protein NDU88_003101 [Pleurodeles waltl]
MPPCQEDPKPGDLIEISRTFYQHWAIYVGDGYVVHLAPPGEYAGSSSIMSVFDEAAVVKKELLKDVAGDCKYRVHNKYDTEYSPLPRSQIVRMAEALVGQKMTYTLTSSNCEHFVTELRYGVKKSKQVDDAIIAGSLALAGLAALGLTAFVVKRNRRQNQ